MNLDDIKDLTETLCSVCASKTGMPELCNSCCENRNKIWDLKKIAQALFDELTVQKKRTKEQKEVIVKLSMKVSEMRIRERALQDTIVHVSCKNKEATK